MQRIRWCVFTAGALALGFGASAVHACDCDLAPEPKVALQQAQAVFVGKVLNIETLPQGDDPKQITLHVGRAWKGVTTEKVVVRTELGQDADCGFPFENGREYLIYAYRVKAGSPLVTDICSRTRLVAEAKDDLAALGPAPARTK